MTMLERFSDIVSSNVNALLDRMEDPEKMIDQYLRNAMEDLAEVKEETAGIMAEEKRCKKLMDEDQANVNKYTELAKKALQSGNEADAKVFLAKKQTYEAELATSTSTYLQAKANADKMKQMHDKLANDVESLKTRKANAKAKIAVAKTQDKMNKAMKTADSTRGAMNAFARMEEKADEMLNQAEAFAELHAEPTDEAAALAAKYGNASSPTVDAELESMKAELGL